MTQDHYAILGVPPTADAASIRAAYLALMREFHPDRNPSPAAVIRSQSIGAAYKVLGDFDRRNQYDWDRRRAREQAAAVLAARPRRMLSAGVVIAAAFGLALGAGMMLQPGSGTIPPPARLPDVADPPPRVAVAQPVVLAPPPPVEPMPPIKPLPDLYPAPPPDPALADEVPMPLAKAAAVPVKVRARPANVVVPAVVVKAVPKPVIVAIKARPATASRPASAPAPATAADLATLDQFVMAFYGQSWRFGDARRRLALEQSRDGFVARRGACLADTCKRAAYLRLQRDVSAIVSGGRTAD